MPNQIFLITITVLEGRHYIWENMDSAVIVRVDNYQKSTAVRKNSGCPYYNEYFVFEFYTTLATLLQKHITILVIQPCKVWRRRKILGEVMLDVATVWQQKSHQFYHKWAILSTSKTDAYAGPRGYLKLDVCVLAKGEIPRTPTNIMNDDIEGNLLLPEGKFAERQRAKYIFDIHNCKFLIDKPSSKIRETEIELEDQKNGPTVYIEITFAGVSVKTSTKKNTSFPEFNERLTIIDMFPPLCQTIKIEACYGDVVRKVVHSQKLINLKQISNDKDEGFLPTLGPIFLHLYSNNILEGFAGTILMSINTELDDALISDSKKGTKIENIAPIIEKKYFDEEPITVFSCISELTAISKKQSKKPICIRMTFGKSLVQNKMLQTGGQISVNTTDETKPKRINKNKFYVDCYTENPCLWILRKVPFFKKRVYNSNILDKIARELKDRLTEIEKLFEDGNSTETFSIISRKISNASDFVETSARKYIEIVGSYRVNYNTKLDIERRKMCIQEMIGISEKVKKFDKTDSNTKMFRSLQKIYNRINFLIEDVQDCWPFVILWLVHGKKKVAFFKVPVKDIIFSSIDEERGQYCGVRRTICFYDNPSNKNHLAAKMDVMMFLCLDRHKNVCVANIQCLDYFQRELDQIPRHLTLQNKQIYQLRCYIFQAKITCGFDQSGLSDPYVSITAQNQLQETQVIEHCLNPVWDQTLVFNGIVATSFYIPSILFEIYDQDECGKSEFIGRSIIIPKLILNMSQHETLKLKWYKTCRQEEISGEVLAAFEYLDVEESNYLDLPVRAKIFGIPTYIKPILVSYRVEVLFWGLRRLGKINFMPIRRPRITVFCGDLSLNSDTIENPIKDPNFLHQTESMTITFPVEKEYAPPLSLRMYDSRRFGVYVYAGVHITRISSFFITPMTVQERHKRLSENVLFSMDSFESTSSSLITTNKIDMDGKEVSDEVTGKKKQRACLFSRCCKYFLGYGKGKSGVNVHSTGTYELLNQEEEDDYVEDYDWWTKFYASMESPENADLMTSKGVRRLKIYDSELESQPEFKGFADMLTSFPIFKGKRTGDDAIDEENITGIFKGAIKIYQYPLSGDSDYVFTNGVSLEKGVFDNCPENDPLRYLLRVYCVRALNLRPKDLNGKSDPYIFLTLNDKQLVDKENYVSRNINPVFGRCFEFNAVFPQDYLLKISIWDYDKTSADDLIGETEIDLENRFYTKHMAFCGLAETYELSGYCTWRGEHKPTCILSEICHKWNVDIPDYRETSVKIGDKEFITKNFVPSGDRELDREVLALTALRRWKEMPLIGFALVPEHVETRSLFHPSKPGIEQGKLQIWIDIFPILDLPPPRKVNISLRKPTRYELRVVIWNTEEVLLDEDDFFSGEKKSDIYVKGWLVDSFEAQYTDVHYRSLTGEGNFNWRFVFHFDYLSTENKIVVRKKEGMFAADETEFKLPCKLTLQVWDNDTFSKDDFIGTLTLELAKLYRPAKTVNKCSLNILEKGAPTVNLFKIRRTRGWWPFKLYEGHAGDEKCTGKVEVELELLTFEEALKDQAGMGRREPQPLPPPHRPDTSFSWFKNPLKALKYVVCKLHKWKIVRCFCFVIIVLLVIAAIYAFPGYTVKRLLGA